MQTCICKMGAVKFSFSVPPASPGTNLPVSSSPARLQAPQRPRRRFSSQDPAAWDKPVSWDVIRHDNTACSKINAAFISTEVLNCFPTCSPWRTGQTPEPLQTLHLMTAKKEGRLSVFSKNTSDPAHPARPIPKGSLVQSAATTSSL